MVILLRSVYLLCIVGRDEKQGKKEKRRREEKGGDADVRIAQLWNIDLPIRENEKGKRASRKKIEEVKND